jgi:TolB-like protein/tetratricopeptide (TPR) repeat protein
MSGGEQPSQARLAPADCLQSWKEIANYFGRGVRTVRRWEKEEGLPVHRQMHKTLGTVYAHRSELDAWREGRRGHRSTTTTAATTAVNRAPTRVMIAVLPFENLSGDVEQEYLADGLTEEMISQLGRSHVATLGVIARTTMMQYRRVRKTVRQIGDELGVDYVVEGSVRREADRLRVTAQLIQVHDQTPIWSGTYEQAIRSVVSLQRELASDIGREIRLTLIGGGRSPVGEPGVIDPEAYDAHLKGRHLLNRFTPHAVQRSLEYFRRAIDLDPGYAASYASLAEAYERMPLWIEAPAASTLPLALEAAERARQLDPNLPEAYTALALIAANYSWDWATAERHFQHALELNPSCAPARCWYAEFLAEMGRFDEALETIDRARRHDPLSSVVLSTRAFVFLMGSRFDEAIAQADLVMELEPEYPMGLIRIGLAYGAKGRFDDAVAALQRAVRAAPELLAARALLGHALARAGRQREALKSLTELRQLAKQRYVPAFLFATVHSGLGEPEKALTFLEKEYDARGWYMLLIKYAPQFDNLRDHPRFQAVIRRMKFPDSGAGS